MFHSNSWKIAIKTNRVTDHSTVRCTNRSGSGSSESSEQDSNEVSSLMEEAKTMWKVGSYHENIVNLQGITVGVDTGTIKRVCYILRILYHMKISFFLITNALFLLFDSNFNIYRYH